MSTPKARPARSRKKSALQPQIRSITYQVNQRGEVVRVSVEKMGRAA